MATGNYDHPSYITTQFMNLGVNTAGANGTSAGWGFSSDLRVRKFTAEVRTAGTSATSGNSAILIYIGTSVAGYNLQPVVLTTTTTTATLGTLALGSSTANTVVTSTDMNARLVTGGLLQMKNGTDATGVYAVTLEYHLDPAATWTGP